MFLADVKARHDTMVSLVETMLKLHKGSPKAKTPHGLVRPRRKDTVKPVAGLWIDHRRAVVVVVTDKGEETRTIESHAEKHIQRAAGSRHGGPFESQAVPADDSHQREYTGELDRYYDRVAAHVRGAEAVMIFGPGEAKGELKKRIEQDPAGGRVVEVETADRMTVSQIVAKVRQRFTDSENPGETRRKSR